MTALAPSISLRRPRLVGAELLKLRKRRGLVITSLVLTLGSVLVLSGITALLHATNSTKHGPAGGVQNLGYGLLALAAFGGLVGTLVGTAAGAGDLSSGVFRELVVTGRSRRALFAARIPGGLAFLLPIVALGYTVAAVSSVVLAGSLAAPSVGLLIGGGAWLLLSVTFWFALALGLSSLVGSRSTTIGVLVAVQLAIAPLLMGLSIFGVGRDAIPGAGVARLAPHAVRQWAVQGRPRRCPSPQRCSLSS
jgi:hypothetical protein